MKCYREWLLSLAGLLLAGCVAYKLEPLPTDHPAHLDATAAPERPASKTLAYAPSDIPSPKSVLAAAAAQREGHNAHPQSEEAAQQTVVGEGKVIATVPNANQIVIEHGEIKGFMGPMTMGYQVDPPSLLKGLKSGDQVRFTIDVQKKTIVKIEK
jgi:Cu/Ag efflux protein CusF